MPPLPDASRLLWLPAGAWALFGARVRAIGLDARYVASALRTGERLDDSLRAPMRTWILRRRKEPAAIAMRLFFAGDAVTVDEARAALGDVAALIDAGFIAERAGQITSPFRLDIAFDRLFVSDDLAAGGDAVMGPSATTSHLCRAARPRTPVETLLDVGCGAGTAAIVLADRAARIVATDINPRALLFTELNARLNGVGNVEVLQGDLFAAVADREFDLIVSQPPFVACPAGEDDAPFLHGGARGDEIALRLLARVGTHLAPGGRAVVLVDWPVTRGDTIEDRVRRAIPEVDVNALFFQSPTRNLEDHCTLHAALAHGGGAGFAQAAMTLRDHFEALQVTGLKLTLNVLERAANPPAWTRTVTTRHFVDAPPTAAVVDDALAAHALVFAGRDALLGARLRLVDGAVFEEPRAILVGDAPVVVVRLPEERLVAPVLLSASTSDAVRAVAEASSVGVVLSATRAEDQEAFRSAIEEALLRGVLVLR